MKRMNWEKRPVPRIDCAIENKGGPSNNLRNTEEDVCIYCDCIVPPNEGYLEVRYGVTTVIHANCLEERNNDAEFKENQR
jgi:hypothetical protein